MKMKKMLSVLLAAGMIATVAAGCGGTGEGGSGDSVTLRIGDNWGSSHPMAAALDEVFKPQIEEQSGGAITVEVYHDGLLGDEGNLWQSVRDGSVDFAVVGTPMNQEFPMMLISDWPFLYRDLDHAKAVWTGEVADEVTAAFNEFFPEVEMLSWEAGIRTGFTLSVGKCGKYLEQYLSAEEWALYAGTYCGPGYEEIWAALFRMHQLFQLVSRKVAEEFNFPLDEDEEQRVLSYLREGINGQNP